MHKIHQAKTDHPNDINISSCTKEGKVVEELNEINMHACFASYNSLTKDPVNGDYYKDLFSKILDENLHVQGDIKKWYQDRLNDSTIVTKTKNNGQGGQNTTQNLLTLSLPNMRAQGATSKAYTDRIHSNVLDFFRTLLLMHAKEHASIGPDVLHVNQIKQFLLTWLQFTKLHYDWLTINLILGRRGHALTKQEVALLQEIVPLLKRMDCDDEEWVVNILHEKKGLEKKVAREMKTWAPAAVRVKAEAADKRAAKATKGTTLF